MSKGPLGKVGCVSSSVAGFTLKSPKSYLLRSAAVSVWHKIRVAVERDTDMFLAKLRLLISMRVGVIKCEKSL